MPSLTTLLGSLLLVSNRPLPVRQLAELTEQEGAAVRTALEHLAELFASQDSGVKMVINGDEYQLVSDPAASTLVERFLKAELLGDLTKPQLETLTIVAYRGPVSKTDIEMIRGVHSGIVLRNLLMRGLISERGRANGLLEYEVSTDTLKHLGLGRIGELPDFQEFHAHPLLDTVLASAPAAAPGAVAAEEQVTTG